MFGLFKKESATVQVVFQISEALIEVAVLRTGSAHTVVLHRSMETLPKQHTRKEAVQALIQSIFEHPEILSQEVKLSKAMFRVILVAPLSAMAEREVHARLKQLSKITKKILNKTLTEGKVLRDESTTLPQDFVLYGGHIRTVSLNGYETENPVGRYAQDIEIVSAQYLTPLAIWSAVAPELEAHFNRECTYAHSKVAIDITRPALVDALFTLPSVAETLDGVLLKHTN